MISFGPIPSRRLGNSLGINNILTPKYCSYGCVYCQVGKTKNYSIKRQVFFEPNVIFREVSNHLKKLDKAHYPNFLTFVSNGEPTLDINLAEIIQLLKPIKIPIAVITNASLLYMDDVVNDLMLADWVSVKIDAPDNETWQAINKPFKKLNFETHIQSLLNFSLKYKGTLCTETMMIEGFNDDKVKIEAIAENIKIITPVKAYISIPTRPPAYSEIKTPEIDKINMAWQIFSDKGISTELLTGFEGTNAGYTGNAFEDVLNITAVHPLREDTMQELLRKNNTDTDVLNSLIQGNYIKQTMYNGKIYYMRKFNQEDH